MISFLAIVLDTWKQSQKQIVFMILLGFLLILSIIVTIIPKKTILENGDSRIGLIFVEEPSPFLEDFWMSKYLSHFDLMKSDEITEEDIQSEDFFKKLEEKQKKEFEQKSAIAESKIDYPKDRRAVEVIVYYTVWTVSFISMILFLTACSGYFPGMLSSGGVDIVLSKPLKRYQIYIAKYLGGLFLYGTAILSTYILIFIGLGIRTNVWIFEIFLAAPIQVFSAAVLFAVLATIGTITRSSTLSLLSGLFIYLFVDSGLFFIIQADKANLFDNYPRISTTVKWIRDLVPNFDMLRDSACSSVMNIPMMEWQPVITGGVWIILMLAIGIFKFQKTDY